MFDENTKLRTVINDSVFDDFGYLLLPVDRHINVYMTLKDVTSSQIYIWYSHLQVNDTINILNALKNQAKNNIKIFYPIYTKEEINRDASKRDTGLFFFKGKDNAPFSIHNAGGGFAYVGAMHDSMPHALELSKRGYNAFVLIYRVNHPYEDLARAIEFIYENAEELKVDKNNYSLWGGSAGARMAATLGNKKMMRQLGTDYISQSKAVIMQYTGYSNVSFDDAPTYSCVGDEDWIASWQVVKNRLERLNKIGIPTEFHKYSGLGHGFGLGRDTVASNWINDAIEFWEKQK